jgi:hypothetical protein
MVFVINKNVCINTGSNKKNMAKIIRYFSFKLGIKKTALGIKKTTMASIEAIYVSHLEEYFQRGHSKGAGVPFSFILIFKKYKINIS